MLLKRQPVGKLIQGRGLVKRDQSSIDDGLVSTYHRSLWLSPKVKKEEVFSLLITEGE